MGRLAGVFAIAVGLVAACSASHDVTDAEPARDGARRRDGGDITRYDGSSDECGPIGATCSTTAGVDQICLPSAFITRGTDHPNPSVPESAPARRVYVSPLWMDRTEVTVRSYRECVAAARCTLPISKYDRVHYLEDANLDKPVLGLLFPQMQEYCAFTGGRLPTETEWERAARGPEGRSYPWGEGIGCDRANWADCTRSTSDVGSYPAGASPEGIMDLIGNAAEATSDRIVVGTDYSAYADEPTCDPAHPVRLATDFYVARGCQYILGGSTWTMEACTGYHRHARANLAYNELGIRCVRDGTPR